MYKEFDKGKTATTITNDPYLILEVIFGEEASVYRHMGFYHGDTSLLEIGTDYATKRIGKIVLVACEEHSERPGELELPDCSEGTLYYEMPREVECEIFKMGIYSNGIRVSLSAGSASEYFKCGNVYFGFGESDTIVEILVAGLAVGEVEHIKEVLREEDEMRGKVFVFDGENWVETTPEEVD